MSKNFKRICAFFLLLIQVFVLIAATPLAGFAEDTSDADTVDAAAAANALGIAHGAHLRPAFIDYGNATWYSYGDEVLGMNRLVGKDLAIVMYFVPWSAFDPFLLDDVNKKVPAASRPAIMLTWEPSRYSNGCDLGYNDGQGPIRSINSGRCDGYIRQYARSIKARPERFIIRFAHEMNITDSAWWPGHYGLDATSYVSMFQRVRTIFREEGAGNAEFMWSPNYASNGGGEWNHIYNYWPGDAYVDWIGLSGYNWYGWRSRPWEEYNVLYDGVLRDMACRYAKPVIISEIGSVDGQSDSAKANWIANLYSHLADYPFVRGIVWFNDFAYGNRGNADFRVTTGGQDCKNNGGCSGVQALPGAAGQQTTNTYINSVRQSVYTSKLPTLAQATPPFTMCSTPTTPFTLSANTVVAKPGSTATLTLQGFLYSSSAQISFQLPTGVKGVASPSTLPAPWGTSTIKLTADSKLAQGVQQGTIRVGSTSLPITIVNLKPRAYLPFTRR